MVSLKRPSASGRMQAAFKRSRVKARIDGTAIRGSRQVVISYLTA